MYHPQPVGTVLQRLSGTYTPTEKTPFIITEVLFLDSYCAPFIALDFNTKAS